MSLPRSLSGGLKPARPGVAQSVRSTQRIVLPASTGLASGQVNMTKPLSSSPQTGRVNLPIGMILRCLPQEVLASDISEFEASGAAATEIGLPMNMILSQLPSGKVEVALQDLVPHFPSGYLQPTQSITAYLPTMINLPLMDVVMRIPPDLLALRPDQKDVDSAVINMADPFTEEILREQAEAARKQAQAETNIVEESQVAPAEEFVPQDKVSASQALKPTAPPMPAPVQRSPSATLPKPAGAPPMPAAARLATPPTPSLRPTGALPPAPTVRNASPVPPSAPNVTARTISPSGRLPVTTRATAPIITRPPTEGVPVLPATPAVPAPPTPPPISKTPAVPPPPRLPVASSSLSPVSQPVLRPAVTAPMPRSISAPPPSQAPLATPPPPAPVVPEPTVVSEPPTVPEPEPEPVSIAEEAPAAPVEETVAAAEAHKPDSAADELQRLAALAMAELGDQEEAVSQQEQTLPEAEPTPVPETQALTSAPVLPPVSEPVPEVAITPPVAEPAPVEEAKPVIETPPPAPVVERARPRSGITEPISSLSSLESYKRKSGPIPPEAGVPTPAPVTPLVPAPSAPLPEPTPVVASAPTPEPVAAAPVIPAPSAPEPIAPTPETPGTLEPTPTPVATSATAPLSEAAPSPAAPAAEAVPVAINLNSCGVDDLLQIPGCSRELATTIVQYRNKIGSFKRLEDLYAVPGMTKVTYTSLTGEAPPEHAVYSLSLNELLGFAPEQTVSLKDVTDRIACWPDVTGCVLSQSSGLSLVGKVPAHLDKAAIVAFAPRMFEALNKSFVEIAGHGTDELIIPTAGTSFHILRNGDLYLIILCRLPQMPDRHLKVARMALAALSLRQN